MNGAVTCPYCAAAIATPLIKEHILGCRRQYVLTALDPRTGTAGVRRAPGAAGAASPHRRQDTAPYTTHSPVESRGSSEGRTGTAVAVARVSLRPQRGPTTTPPSAARLTHVAQEEEEEEITLSPCEQSTLLRRVPSAPSSTEASAIRSRPAPVPALEAAIAPPSRAGDVSRADSAASSSSATATRVWREAVSRPEPTTTATTAGDTAERLAATEALLDTVRRETAQLRREMNERVRALEARVEELSGRLDAHDAAPPPGPTLESHFRHGRCHSYSDIDASAEPDRRAERSVSHSDAPGQLSIHDIVSILEKAPSITVRSGKGR